MCTISYIPKGDSFIFTANRDEHISRAAINLQTQKKDDGSLVYYPEDPFNKGSWIGIDTKGKMACLINGASKRHNRTPPYRESRGQILLKFFDYDSIDQYLEKINIDNIEPFTLILIDSQEDKLIQLRWDGTEKDTQELPSDDKYVWSSATLYSEDLAKEKEEHFFRMLDTNLVALDKHILSLHALMKYEDLIEEKAHELIYSTSITQVINSKRGTSITMNSLIYDIVLEARLN